MKGKDTSHGVGFFFNCKFSIVNFDFLYFCGFLLLRTDNTYA